VTAAQYRSARLLSTGTSGWSGNTAVGFIFKEALNRSCCGSAANPVEELIATWIWVDSAIVALTTESQYHH